MSSLSFKQNLANLLGPKKGGQVVSTRTTSPSRVSPSQTKSITDRYNKESEAKNAQIQAQLDAQRKGQADLMAKAREHAGKRGASRRQEITDLATKQQGAATQNLISRGLGNTTIQDSVSRGITSDMTKSMTYQRDLEAGRVSNLYAQEGGMQIPQGQFQLGGIDMMSGGLEDYIRLLQMLGGGLS